MEMIEYDYGFVISRSCRELWTILLGRSALREPMADYYYEERMCLLRCVLLLLTYFQDERHPYRTEYSNCVNKLEKDLVSNYQSQFENLFKAEAPTWETHGNLMVRLFHS
ncbi:hypothetical protein GOODEAATRI_021152 [Goodea atripinnis]|uniref:Nucleoporin Nup188 N-terminal domain-containing protein n=1 Tax=Goodea atripinnis TaxID=208336 RepID=A0ABV0NFR1_9TELE